MVHSDCALTEKDYTSEVKAAWEWLWAWLSQVMAQTLEDARNETTVLSHSWDIALDRNTEEELGGLLYDTLFDLAPNLKPVFKKPREVCIMKCVVVFVTFLEVHSVNCAVYLLACSGAHIVGEVRAE